MKSITWTASSDAAIKPGEFQQFLVSVGLPDFEGDLVFPTAQTYSNGKVVNWVQQTPPGGPEPENPAPTVTLTKGGADDGSTTPTTASSGGSSSVLPEGRRDDERRRQRQEHLYIGARRRRDRTDRGDRRAHHGQEEVEFDDLTKNRAHTVKPRGRFPWAFSIFRTNLPILGYFSQFAVRVGKTSVRNLRCSDISDDLDVVVRPQMWGEP